MCSSLAPSLHLCASLAVFLNRAPFCVEQLPSHDRSLLGLGVKVEAGVSWTTRSGTLQTVPLKAFLPSALRLRLEKIHQRQAREPQRLCRDKLTINGAQERAGSRLDTKMELHCVDEVRKHGGEKTLQFTSSYFIKMNPTKSPRRESQCSPKDV